MLKGAGLVGAVLLVASAAAETRRQDAPVLGQGTATCAQAMTPEAVAGSRAWLLGYLTAFGESFAPPSIWLGDADAVTSLLDETCAAFPKFTLAEATRWVILTLQDRRYNKKK